jgi:hypothetical protein
MPMPSQTLGENFHFVGLTQNFNTSPPPPPNAKRTQKPSRLAKETIQIDDEEVRLVINLFKPSHIYNIIQE